jgi:hypothetical protein
VRDGFYRELERLLGDFNTKVFKEDIFKPTIGNESLHEIINDNGVRVIYFATSKNLSVKSTMLPHRNIHKFTWTNLDGKTKVRLTILWKIGEGIRSFRAADCDTDHYLVVAKFRERLAVNKQ